MRRPAWSREADQLAVLQRVPGLDDLTPDWAWGGGTGRGVRVGIIDSGIDATHPAVDGHVAGYVALEVDDASGQIVSNDEPHIDPYGHGTACADIIRRLAPDCELYSIKVLDGRLIGRAAAFAAGLRWAIDHQLHVVNLSLGTTRADYSVVFHELADEAYFNGIVLVTAANNTPVTSYPSLYASVTSVACHPGQDPFEFYYNHQPPVEFLAPGINLRVAWTAGGTSTITGNSFAAPHISGLVARILGKHPGLAPFQVKTVLRATARNSGVSPAWPDSPPAR